MAPTRSSPYPSDPPSRRALVDRYFLEHRAKVIDVAAFLDRLDRAPAPEEDFRITALRHAVEILLDGRSERARRILELLSDPSTELPTDARGSKGALGAPPPVGGGA
ncbi:MAG: hypothetical protein KDC38_09355 [Planctomycetes bacterium]|nr:hypothetical protein [Planctomycetota bacterium]